MVSRRLFSDLVMLDVFEFTFVCLCVRSASSLVEHLLDLTRVDEIIDLIAGFSPVALTRTLFLHVVRSLAEVPGMSEVLWVWSGLVFCPFICSGHCDVYVFSLYAIPNAIVAMLFLKGERSV